MKGEFNKKVSKKLREFACSRDYLVQKRSKKKRFRKMNSVKSVEKEEQHGESSTVTPNYAISVKRTRDLT